MNTRPLGLLLTECNANYRTAWQASEQEKSYLINIRRQQQLRDDKRKPVVVTIQCGGRVPMSQVRPKEFLHKMIRTTFRLNGKRSFAVTGDAKIRSNSKKSNPAPGDVYSLLHNVITNHSEL